MDATRFDSLSRALTARLSRRSALQASGAGLAAGLAVGASLRAVAQDATPDPLSDDATFLFVQSAASGTFAANPGAGTPTAEGTPVAGGGGDYLLTLEGHAGNTVYFSDRPERIFGSAPTQRFLDGLGFAPSNPPNAALVTNDENGNEDVLVVELLTPTYDADNGTITYGVNLLSDYEGGLDFVANRQGDEDLAPTFGTSSLFIDDCPDTDVYCYTRLFAKVGFLGTYGQCWSWGELTCNICDDQQGLVDLCNSMYPDCNNDCTAG